MKKHIGPLLLIALLLIVAMFITSCEKERPAPAAAQTPAAGKTSDTRSPQANVTTVVLPTKANAGAAGGASTAPSAAASSAGSQPTPQPLASTTTTTAPSVAGPYFTYTVIRGDTLAKIARKFNVTPESVVALNALPNPDIVTPGQELKIPGQSPTQSPAAQPATGSSASPSTYTVKPGETLFGIATRLGVSLAALQQANDISNADQVYSGQVLKIPGGATESTSGGQAKNYVVQSGDTLNKIAVRLGLTMAALQAANNLSDPNQIYSGQVLKVP
jgi:lysozyme